MRVGAVAACLAHTQEDGGAIPSPATKQSCCSSVRPQDQYIAPGASYT